jgi:putative ABC transport system permease protein
VNTKYLHTLLIVAILTLSISIVNFLFLFIGSAEKRIIGSGIKKIYGASKPVLFLEYLMEVVILMLISVAFSIVLYFFYHVWVVPYFTFLPEIILFDYKLIILLAGVSVLVAFLAGIYPSIVLSAYNPVGLIKFKGTVKRHKFKLVNLLVTVQFTLCIILIVSSIMMNKQTRFMENQNTGYAKDELITIPLNMHVGEGINNNRFVLFSEELKKYPGIKNVSLSFSSPASIITDKADVSWEGKPEGENVMMNWESISYDYFKTIGIKLIQGRSFSPDFPNDIVNWDTRNCSFIINESAVEEMEIADPVGKEFKVWAFHGPIVGVVEDYNFKSLHSEIGPVFYMMSPIFFNVIVIRMTPPNHQLIKNIEEVWNKFVPDYPLEIDYVNIQVHSLYKSDQNLANILNVFSILTILIACMGLFTLTILSVNHRTKEIGIRKVIGAKIVEVMLMLIKNSIKWVVIAFIIGTPLAWYIINKWLENFAYKTTIDWWIFSLAGLIAILIALITVSFHSWKAARRNPVEVLRYE